MFALLLAVIGCERGETVGARLDVAGCRWVSVIYGIAVNPEGYPRTQGFNHYTARVRYSNSVQADRVVHLMLPGATAPWPEDVTICSMSPWRPDEYYARQDAACTGDLTLCFLGDELVFVRP